MANAKERRAQPGDPVSLDGSSLTIEDGLAVARGTRAAYRALREAGVAPLVEDRVLAPDIERIAGLIRSRRSKTPREDVDGD